MKIRLSGNGMGALLAILGIVMFSAKAVMVKLGYRYDVDTVTLLLLRMLFALPIYLVIAYRETISKGHVTIKEMLQVIVLGFVGYYIASYLDFYGLQFISASLERLILFVYPTLVILISAAVLRKKPSKLQVTAIVITYLGIFVTFADDLTFVGGGMWLGVGAIFLSAFTYAFYLVGSGELIPKIGAMRFTAYAMTVSCVMVIIHYLIANTSEVLHQPWEVYSLGFAMAIISTVVPSFLIAEAIRRLGASNFSIFGSLGPISTILLAIAILGERLDIYQVTGTIIVIFGVSIISIKNK